MGKYVTYYCDNGGIRLKKIVDRIIRMKFRWLPQSEYDDFYSIAGQTVWYCESRYDVAKNNSFEKYLTDSLNRKFKTRITYLNRKKRKGDEPDVCLDAFVSEEEKLRKVDCFAEKQKIDIHPLTQRYLDSLTNLQREVAELIMKGYDNKSIKHMLNLTDKRFDIIYHRMKTEEKKEPLNKMRRNEK